MFQQRVLKVLHGFLQLQRSCSAVATLVRSPTIYALSSGAGKAGLAVVRVSGAKAGVAVKSMIGSRPFPEPRRATLTRFHDPNSKEPIDKGLVLWFPGPHSFTGEDCAEFHVHGGPAVVTAILSALGGLSGFRHAEQGEFTKRAFLHGKLDLTEVEGLGDLIEAETEGQRRQALRQLEGELGGLYTQWRTHLIQCLANVEAFIDFGEDQNIEDDVMAKVEEQILQLIDRIRSHLHDSWKGERLRSGVRVAILGKPNVGKSTLLNTICQRPAAIVSPVAGTTRDVIETAVNIGGYPALLADTAGLRDAEDLVEKEGVKRALERAKDADLKVILLDNDSTTLESLKSMSLADFVEKLLEDFGLVTSLKESCLENQPDVSIREDLRQGRLPGCIHGASPSLESLILVVNKSDLLTEADHHSLKILQTLSEIPICVLSCQTKDGLEKFLGVLCQQVKRLCGDPLEGNPSLTQARHRTHLTNCSTHLQQYVQFHNVDVVIAAEQLRKASRDLGKIIGKINTEDILDVIFKDFCIGK